MPLIENTQCHTNQFKALVNHLHTRDTLHKDTWSQPPHEKNKKMTFRSKHGVDTDLHQSLPISLSLEEFASYGHSNYYTPPNLIENPQLPGQPSPSNLSASWSSSSLGYEGHHGWLSDFCSFSSSSPSTAAATASSSSYHHSKPTVFAGQHTFIRYPPHRHLSSPTFIPINSTHRPLNDTSKSWDTAFAWYESHNNIESSRRTTSLPPHHNSTMRQTIDTFSSDEVAQKDNRIDDEEQNMDDRTAGEWTTLGMELQERDDDVGAIEAFHHALDLNASSLDAWLGLAISYANEHHRGKVYDCLESWLDHNEKYTTNDTPTMKDRHTTLVDRYLVAARCAPGGDMDADIQIILGLLFYLADDRLKAKDCFRAALACRPDDHRLWNQLGSVMDDDEMYWTALDLNPQYIRARYNLAILYMKRGRYDHAAHHLVKALHQQVSLSNHPGSPMWSSLRLVMYMLNLDHLADACNRYDLDPFDSFLNSDTSC